jgi:glycosyltransferase involved in cell wall biosynthesis
MRIAQIAPLAESVPPKLYGGTERVVSWLTEELVNQGHDVTLFASGDSITSADLVPCVPMGLRLAGFRDHTGSLLVMLSEVRDRADEFDMIHFHVEQLQVPLFYELRQKCISTLHGRLDMPDFHPVYKAFPKMPLVSISDSQRRPLPPGINWVATVPHGLPEEDYHFNPKAGEYLAFLGRMSPEKRPDRAIEVAKRVGIPLKMAAKVDPSEVTYFEQTIKPLLDHPLIEFIGEIGDDEKQDFLGNALALLFPIDWPEPFGLVMIEAMAVGTPVIAWRAGSVDEVIDEGLSGIIVDSIDEMVAAVGRAQEFSRQVVRERFEARFTAAKMARSYVRTYERCRAMDGEPAAAPIRRERQPIVVDGLRKSRVAQSETTAVA